MPMFAIVGRPDATRGALFVLLILPLEGLTAGDGDGSGSRHISLFLHAELRLRNRWKRPLTSCSREMIANNSTHHCGRVSGTIHAEGIHSLSRGHSIHEQHHQRSFSVLATDRTAQGCIRSEPNHCARSIQLGLNSSQYRRRISRVHEDYSLRASVSSLAVSDRRRLGTSTCVSVYGT